MQLSFLNRCLIGGFFLCLVIISVVLYFKAIENHAAGYWVWRQSDLKQLQSIDEIIIYQGEFYNTNGEFTFRKKGIAIQDLHGRNVTLLLRAYQLPSVHFFTSQVDYLINEWQQKGVSIKGIQIDYDSPSSKLHEYGAFLRSLNHNYEPSFISITGLSSWMTDNIKGLNSLASYIDYVAIQFYQAFNPVYKAEHHIKQLKNLTLNYKVGVTTSKLFDRYTFDETKHYRGKLIFMNGKILGKNK